MNCKLKYIILFAFILPYKNFISAQYELDKGSFIMGVFNFDHAEKKFSIRSDTLLNKVIQNNDGAGNIILTGPQTYISDGGYWDRSYYYDFQFDKFGNEIQSRSQALTKHDTIIIDYDYWRSDKFSSNLILLGKTDLKKTKVRKVKNLQCYPHLGGLVGVEMYKNLESLTIPYNPYSPSIQKLNDFNSFPKITNHGEPFLNSYLNQLKSLKHLQIEQPLLNYSDNYYYSGQNDFLLLQGISSSVFSLPKLESLKLTGLTFLPVNFHDFRTFNFLEINEMFKPELVNLALIMYSFNKDTTEGNWKNILNLGNKNLPIIIPENGKFKSYYANGQIICEGNYVDSKPHGTWRFWYENGTLCEKREYTNGIKTGKWVFFSNSINEQSNQDIDTLHLLVYSEDKLIKRIDTRRDEYPPSSSSCYDFHTNNIDWNSVLISEYNLVWDNSNLVSIDRSFKSLNTKYQENKFILIGDTLGGFNEHWSFQNGNWEYSIVTLKDMCSHEKMEYFAKGLIGNLPTYFKFVKKYDKRVYGYEKYYSNVLDLKTNQLDIYIYSNELDNSRFQLIEQQHIKEEILPKYWSDPK